MNPLQALIALLVSLFSTDDDPTAEANEVVAALNAVEAPEGVTDADLEHVPAATIEAAIAALVDAGQDEDVPTADLLTIADTVDYLRADLVQREEAAAADAEAREALLARLQGGDDDEGGDGSDGSGGDGSDDENADTGGDGADADEDADAAAPALTASRGTPPVRIGRVAARGSRRAAAAATADDRGDAQVRIRLLRDVGDFVGGTEFASLAELAPAFDEAIAQFGHLPGGEKTKIARLSVEYPEDRQLDSRNPDQNTRRVREALDAGRNATRSAASGADRVRALTASGGLCAPRTPYYGLAQLGDNGRPVRAALPGFQANRGGITFMPPPDYAAGIYDAGVAVWTAENDENPTDPATKPFLVLDCDDPITVDIEAITEGLEVGNFRARSWPEQVENFMHGVSLVHARTAETQLINSINAASLQVTAPQALGAARDFLFWLDLAAVSFRDTRRMGDDDVMDVFVPHWMRAAVRGDLMQEMPGAQAERLATTNGQLDDWLAVRNLRPVWFRDTQNFPVQTDGALIKWPEQVKFYLSHPGAFLFLDGGTLDLGVFRDSSLVETNDYRIFSETFEGLAAIGIAPEAITMQMCLNGATAGTIDPDTLCAIHDS